MTRTWRQRRGLKGSALEDWIIGALERQQLVRAAQAEVAEIRARGEVPDPAMVQLAESEDDE